MSDVRTTLGMGNISILCISWYWEPTIIVSWWFYNYHNAIFTLLVVLLHKIRHTLLRAHDNRIVVVIQLSLYHLHIISGAFT